MDWKRTLYDPETRELIPGAIELLQSCFDRKIPLYLIGKGKEDMYSEVKRLKVEQYFKEILFVGTAKKPQDFIKFLDTQNPQTTFVIGDRATSELAIGKSLSCTTIWIRQGQFASEEPENQQLWPDYVVGNLGEVESLIN